MHANVHNHFNLERHLVDRQTYKERQPATLTEWQVLASEVFDPTVWENRKPRRQSFKRYPIGFFHMDIVEVQTTNGKLYLFFRNRPHQQVRRHTAGRQG